MEQHELIGLVLMISGLAEVPVGWIVTQRIEDKQKRLILAMALLSSSTAMLGLGAAFLFGWIPLG